MIFRFFKKDENRNDFHFFKNLKNHQKRVKNPFWAHFWPKMGLPPSSPGGSRKKVAKRPPFWALFEGEKTMSYGRSKTIVGRAYRKYFRENRLMRVYGSYDLVRGPQKPSKTGSRGHFLTPGDPILGPTYFL